MTAVATGSPGAGDAAPLPGPPPGGKRSVLRSPWFWAVITGLITIPLVRPLTRHIPEPPPVLFALPEFALTDQDGRALTSQSLRGTVYIVNFIFTRCPSACPLLTKAMHELQNKLELSRLQGLQLVSVSVDPAHDTPEVLKRYADTWGARRELWRFATGSPEAIKALVVGGFKEHLGEPEPVNDAFDIAHAVHFVLVDGAGNVRGFYGADEMGIDEVFHRAQHVLRQQREQQGART